MELNEEIRCGYLVTKERKGIWKTQIEMLSALLDVCARHDIQIFAVAGTMLGAVRHKGYIPWDDDIDLAMKREDFEKLLKVGNTEFSYPYFLQTAVNDLDYYSPLIRLRDSRTTAIIRNGNHDDWGRSCNNGIYLDIFPLDGLVENRILRSVQFFEIRLLNMIMRERVYEEKGKGASQLRHGLFKSLISPTLLTFIYKRYNKVCSRYSYTTERVALLEGSVYNKSYYWYLDDINDVTWMPFETIKIPIPKGYERCLRIQYGKYEELPPLEERGKHHALNVIFDPFTDYSTYIENNDGHNER